MRNFRYFLVLALLLAGFFELLRLAMLLRYLPLTAGIPAGVVLRSFLVGLRFDLSITGYILALPVVVGMLPKIGWGESPLTRKICTVYVSMLAAVAFFLNIVDLEFFGWFNTRLNHIAFDWSDTPGISLAIVWETVPVPLYLLLWVLVTVLFIWVITRINRKFAASPVREPNWRLWAIYPLALGLTFLAIRGRVAKKSPINWSVAYFSPYYFANQLALNSVFTFVRDAVLDRNAHRRSVARESGMTDREAFALTRSLLGIDEDNLVGRSPLARREIGGEERRLNVIVVLGESFAANFIGACGGSCDFAPEFDRIAQDGLLFTRFYSSGYHTYAGIFSTLTGLPNLPGRPVMKISEGQQQFAGLGTLLKGRGYTNYAYVTHDPHFDNMQGFLLGNGFDRVVGQFDYPQDEVLSTLGVPDEVMFDRALEDFASLPRPFFAFLLTASHHGPFIVPDRPHPKPDRNQREAKRINAFYYADWALGKFYDGVRSAAYGDSTLFVVLADNGVTWDARLDMDFSSYWIPLLLVAPGVIEPGVSERIGGQKDLTATVMDVLGGEWINATLGSSLLKPGLDHALMVEGQRFGYLEEDLYLIKHRDGRLSLYSYPECELIPTAPAQSEILERHAQALLTAATALVFERRAGLPQEK